METSLGEREIEFLRPLVAEYLKYGSAEAVFRAHRYNLPISYPDFQRKLAKWGIVKAAGPNSKLSEAICILSSLSEEKIPLERLYRQLPPSVKTSLSTMHRILHCVKEQIIRRLGTALVVTSESDPNVILVGEDISTPRLELGKPFGAISLPMGYSKKDEDPKDSVLRVLQQEVFTNQTVVRKFPYEILPKNPKPFMFVDIADVGVAVYQLILPTRISELENFSSFKLRNHTYLPVEDLTSRADDFNFRAGVHEIGVGYNRYLHRETELPIYARSIVNEKLLALSLEAVV